MPYVRFRSLFVPSFSSRYLSASLVASSLALAAAHGADSGRLVAVAALPPTSLQAFHQPAVDAAALDRARQHGLEHTDLPSLGSGLTPAARGEFYGLTDRGPNEDHLDAAGVADGVIFPLPDFSPSIVRFRVEGEKIQPVEYLPLTGKGGALLSGLPNVAADGTAYSGPGTSPTLPCDPSGLDTEAIRLLPDGRFLLGEEYGPSLLVTDAHGKVLMRYLPAGKQLSGARYPVSNTLPAELASRRKNRGFESVALSADGKTAYATLESPLGDTADPALAASRMLRTIKLDVSDPLKARVVAEYLTPTGALADFPGTAKQADIKAGDAAWLANDRILLMVRGKGLVRLALVDFREATNLLQRPEAAGTTLERADAPLSKLGIRPATFEPVFASTEVPEIDQEKLEGLAIIAPDQVALISDNDFGTGDNKTGAPCKFWRVRLARPLPQ